MSLFSIVVIIIMGILTPTIALAQPKESTGIKETTKPKFFSCSAAETIKEGIDWIKGSHLNVLLMQGSRLHSPKWIADIRGTFDKASTSQLSMSQPARELFSDRRNGDQPYRVDDGDNRTFALTVKGGKTATLSIGSGTELEAKCADEYIYATEGDEFIVLKLTRYSNPK